MSAVIVKPTLMTQKAPAMKNETYKGIGCEPIGYLA
jgi:hypothetical protein